MRNNLLVYTENYQRGGGNKYAISVINNLATVTNEIIFVANKSGLFPEEKDFLANNVILKEIRMMSSSALNQYSNQYKYRGIIFKVLFRIANFLLKPLFLIYQMLLFFIILLRTRPKQIIIFNGGYPGARSCQVLAVIARFFTRDISMSIVSMPIEYKKITKFFAYYLDVLVWKSCKFVVTNCTSIAEALTLQRALPTSKDKRVLLNGVDDIDNYSQYKKKINESNETIIGYVGRIEESKGVMVIVDAFKMISGIHPQARLHIYGDGHEMDLLKKKIDSFGIEKLVKVFGHYNEPVSEIFKLMDIYTLPSYREGLSYSLLEAMRSGVAIIATDVGGTKEAINHLENGIIVPTKSVESMYRGLTLLIKNSELRKRLGIEARRVFLNKFESSNFQINSINVFLGIYQK